MLRAIFATGRIIDVWLPHKIQYEYIPGLSVGITYRGKLVYKKGFGYADIESKTKATSNTCYRIASISKTFTAMSALRLVEQGRLSLDDRVEKYLPWFKAKNKNGRSNNITVRQILSHSAGLFRDGASAHWINDNFPDSNRLKKSVSGKTIVFENLTRFKYSNFGYAVLGQLIEKISGISYDKYVSRFILKKLKLENTASDFSEEILSNLAAGYGRLIPGQNRDKFLHTKTNAYAPATGFISNVPDLAKYLVNFSLLEKSNGSIISRESRKEMTREYSQSTEEGEFYGLGLRIYRIDKKKIVGHGGSFAGYSTTISLDTENDIGVIVLSNTLESKAGFINRGIFETIYNLLNSEVDHSKRKSSFSREKYEGVYRSRWGDDAVIGLKDKLIVFNPTEDFPLKRKTSLKPVKKDQFLMESNLNFDSPGEIARFIFNKGDKKARKMFWGSTPSERIE